VQTLKIFLMFYTREDHKEFRERTVLVIRRLFGCTLQGIQRIVRKHEIFVRLHSNLWGVKGNAMYVQSFFFIENLWSRFCNERVKMLCHVPMQQIHVHTSASVCNGVANLLWRRLIYVHNHSFWKHVDKALQNVMHLELFP
jgi:hypothetical protein